MRPCIALILTRLIHGGAQENVILTAERLLQKGYRVVLMHGPGNKKLQDKLPLHPHFKSYYIPEFRRRILPFRDLCALLQIWRYLKQEKPDIVHTHTSKAGILGRWAARWAGVPIIVHSPRGSIYHSVYFSGILLSFFSFLERWTSAFTDKIITVSESEKRDYAHRGIAPLSKFATVYSGIEVRRYTDISIEADQKKRELRIPFGGPVIGYVARLTPEKGHLLCLEAFKKIVKKIPEAVLVLVGDGPRLKPIKEAIKKQSLEKNVFLLGERNDIAEILRILDCYVQTSIWEGLPRSMVEAMLAERPVVAFQVGGIPEVLFDLKTGFLVPEGDVSELAQKVMVVLKDKALARKLGQAAKMRMAEVFDIDRTAEKIALIYESLLKEKKREIPR